MSGRRLTALLMMAAWQAVWPAMVAAAGPNQLSNGWVSPTSGTQTTTFTFSVDYSSDKDFAAASVVTFVAGRVVPLSLVGGTLSNGTFQGTASLPAGTWPVSFEAQASQGPSASLAGPTLIVTAPAPPPTPAPTPPPAPPIGPLSPPPASAGAATARPATSTLASASPGAAPGAGGVSPSGPPAQSPSGSSSPTIGPVSPIGAGSTAVDVEEDGPSGGGPALVWLGLLGVSVLAAGIVVAVKSRRWGDEVPEAADREAMTVPSTATISAIGRAPTEQVEDPILAAMGLGALKSPRTDAPLTHTVRSGPGERPARPTAGHH